MKVLRWLADLFLPADEAREDDPPEETAGAAGDEGGEAAEAAEAGAEGGEGDAGEGGDDELARLKTENERLTAAESERKSSIREEAERLLQEMLPEIGEEYERPTARAQDAGGAEDEEPTEAERLQRLEARQRQVELDRESERLVAKLKDAQATRYPHLDIGRTLTILANAGDRPVNLDRLCQLVNDSELAEKERYHKERIADPEYRKSLARELTQSVEEAAAGAEAAGGAQGAGSPPRIPRKSAAGVPGGGKPITRKNASQVFAERLRSSGWAGR